MNNTEGFDSVLERIKQATGLDRDADVAKFLGMSPQALNNRKKTGSAPTTEIVYSCSKQNIDLNYIFRGKQGSEEGAQLTSLDEELLLQIVEGVELLLEKYHRMLSAEKKARVIVLLYKSFSANQQVDQDTIRQVIELAA